MKDLNLRSRIENTHSRSLQLRARILADGWAAGTHRSERKGSGVEFAGHRNYTPGDDLRHLDRHALLRHGHLLVREFHTDTERSVHLLIDLTPSMQYAGDAKTSLAHAPESKLSRALLLAGAIATVARDARDSIGLTLVSNHRVETHMPHCGREAFQRILCELENLDSKSLDHALLAPKGEKQGSPVNWQDVFFSLGSRLPRGTLLFFLSDFLDITPALAQSLAALCTKGRLVRATQILTPAEVDFPFTGPLRFRSPETLKEIETDAQSVRALYMDRLEKLTESSRSQLTARGGSLLRSRTDNSPALVLRHLLAGSEPHKRELAAWELKHSLESPTF